MRQDGNGTSGRGGVTALVAWTMCGLSLTLTGLGLLLLVRSLPDPRAWGFDYWVENIVVAVGFSTVGAIIAPRARNAVAWVLCSLGLLGGIRLASAQYAIHSLLVDPGSLPYGEVPAWLTTWVWVPHIGLLVFMALLFPDGRLAGRRWRWVAWSNLVVALAGAALAAFAPGPVFGIQAIGNPLGSDALPNLDQLIEALVYIFGMLAATSLVVRLGRVGPVQRQQIKWFVYALTIGSLGAVCGYVISPEPGTSWVGLVGFVLIMASILGMPVAIAFAILRYRLYDIDRLINRTLVYGLLSSSLGLAYALMVLVIGQLFGGMGGRTPSWAIAAATLAVAAAFQPARRRVQEAVDRRFYRRRYDAARTIEAFSGRLRHHTDLPTLSGELLAVVDQTMRPTTASLWLRPPPGS